MRRTFATAVVAGPWRNWGLLVAAVGLAGRSVLSME